MGKPVVIGRVEASVEGKVCTPMMSAGNVANKPELAAALQTLAALLQIEGASQNRVRILMSAADAVLQSPLPFDELIHDVERLPGFGAATALRIRQLATQGLAATLADMQITTPPSVIDLTRVAGIGPKTAFKIYEALGVATLADLDSALRDGRLQTVSGIGAKSLPRMRRDIAVLRQGQTHIPIAKAWPLACEVREVLRGLAGVMRAEITGDVRRLSVLSARVECILATRDGTGTALEPWLNQFPHTLGDASVDLTLSDGAREYPVRIHFATEDAFAARWMDTTGDATHQAVIEGLFAKQGCAWRAEGFVDEHDSPMCFATEEAIYAHVGLPYYPPEIREEASLLYAPASLVTRADIRGDLHVHSTWSDGSQSIRKIIQSAARLGYAYVAITDHSQSLAIAGGLTPEDLRRQRAEIDEVQAETDIRILHGIEVDILADGRLDLPDDTLHALDIVVASVHSAMNQSKLQMTERLLRAVEHPTVDIIGHISGRKIGLRAAYEFDFDKVLAAAVRRGVAIELNANPNRLDISEPMLRQVRAVGGTIAIDTDAHHASEFDHMAYGTRMAKRGGIEPSGVINALGLPALLGRLHGRR